MKAFSYLRVSGKSQVDGDGFPRQREAIQAFSKAHSITIQEEFRDEGVSGTTELADRESLAKLLDRIESNGVRTVLVERADRIARDLMVGEIILSQFRQLGVKVIEVSSGNDLTAEDQDPTKILIRQILGAVSQFEKSVIVSKPNAARERQRRQNGRCQGRKPFGSQEGESFILANILAFRRKRAGKRMSYAKIATHLNTNRIRSRSGKPWKPGTIRNIVARIKPNMA